MKRFLGLLGWVIAMQYANAQNNLSGMGNLNALTGALKGWQAGSAQRDYQDSLNQTYIDQCRANTPPVLLSYLVNVLVLKLSK